MCYVGGGDVSLARWEMNKPVCVRTGVRERNAGERWVLRVELDCGALGTEAQQTHTNTHCTNRASGTKKITDIQFLKHTVFGPALDFKHTALARLKLNKKRRDIVKRDYCF